MLVAYCRLCCHCCNLAKGGCLSLWFHFTRCRYFFGPCRLSEFTLVGPLCRSHLPRPLTLVRPTETWDCLNTNEWQLHLQTNEWTWTLQRALSNVFYRLLSRTHFRKQVYLRHWILRNSFRHHTNDLLMDSSKASYDSEYDWTTDNLINDNV